MILNYKELIENAKTKKTRKGRKIILEAFNQAVKSAMPDYLIKKFIQLQKNILYINGDEINLNNVSNIYVIGAGKASGEMARCLYNILNDRITKGIINVPENLINKYRNLKKFQFYGAGHPLPNENGIIGTEKMLDIINNSTESDIIICLISGGGSALMTLPANQISLDDIKKLTNILLKSGMTINEINTIRKHISRVKGGQLIKNNRAKFYSLIISDVLNDPIDMIASGPTVPDNTTYMDALNLIKKYSLLDKIPPKILEHLKQGVDGKISETLKPNNFNSKRVKNIIIGNLNIACDSAIKSIKKYGIPVKNLPRNIQGEASQIGIKLLNDLLKYERPVALVGGGETTVTVKGKGKGGRNQEMILSALRNIEKDGIIISSIGTDGIDGTTDAAGALADINTKELANKFNLNIDLFLKNNDSYNFFKKINDALIFTGYTGTNVNDIYIFIAL